MPARRIAAITFTNKAAREMRERIGKRLKGDAAEGLTLCTFHALGLRFLQIEHEKAGLRRGFSVFDADDTTAQIKDLPARRRAPDALDNVRNLISRAKNAGSRPSRHWKPHAARASVWRRSCTCGTSSGLPASTRSISTI